jgi:hypothetical protein
MSIDMKWEVKKGDKFVLEIEITKDHDLYEEGNILRSIYRGYEFDGVFKITTLHLIKGFDVYKRRLAAAISDAIIHDRIELKPLEDEQPNISHSNL